MLRDLWARLLDRLPLPLVQVERGHGLWVIRSEWPWLQARPRLMLAIVRFTRDLVEERRIETPYQERVSFVLADAFATIAPDKCPYCLDGYWHSPLGIRPCTVCQGTGRPRGEI